MESHYLLAVLVVSTCISGLAAASQKYKIHSDSKVDVYSFTLDTEYISLFAITSEGVLVVEPVRVDHSKAMLQEIRSIAPNHRIKYCIYSHNHWDHEGGGQVWRDAGAVLVAHEEAIEYFKFPGNLRVPDVVMPDYGWSGTKRGDKHVLTLGGVKFELIYLQQSHGFGMSALYMPDQGVAYFSDIVNPNRVMFTIVPEFNTQEWQATLLWIINNMQFTKGVYTHNKRANYMEAGTMRDVQEQHDFIVDMRNKINDLIEAGTHPLAVPGIIRLPKYQSWAFYNDWLQMNAWRMVMERWMGPWPFRPDWPLWKGVSSQGDNSKTVNVNVNVNVDDDHRRGRGK